MRWFFWACPSLIKTEFNYWETSKSEENTKKYLSERYLDSIFVPVIPGSKSYIRFTMMDELQKMDLRQTNSVSSYILNEKNYNPFEKYLQIKSLNRTMLYLSISTYSVVVGIYSERGCHVTYANLKPDWFIKIATANQSVAMAIIRLQQISFGSLSLWIAECQHR